MKRIIIGILVFSCLLISVTASAQTSEGMIVFTKSALTRDGFREFILKEIFGERNWWTFFLRDICVINPDGTGFRQLTDDNASYRPLWSPDGRKIAFCSGTPPSVSIHVMNPDGSDRVATMKGQNYIDDFKWSPDGTKIMVHIRTKSPRDPEETWIVDAAGKGTVKRIRSDDWAFGWYHWDAKGATVFKPNRRLMEALPDDTQWPEWSPDNRYVAFMYENKLRFADTTIVGMPDEWRQGYFDPPCNELLEWSPDGGRFLFLGGVPDGGRFFFLGGGYVSSVNVDGTELTNLNMSKSTYACWSPDGTHVAYTAADIHKENTEIYIMNSDGTGHVQLTSTNYFHMDVDW